MSDLPASLPLVALAHRKAYHPATSLSLAYLCALVYEKRSVVTSQAAKWGFDRSHVVDVRKARDIDTQCTVFANDRDIVAAFRGSSALEDWFTNFQAVTDPGPLTKTKAHEGFQDALFPAVLAISNAIDEFRTTNQNIWITGHSLGGALCSLYAGMLVENGYPVYGVYTFASPRAGNVKFASQLDTAIPGPHYRVVNAGDFVPHVPPEPFFSHAGKRILLHPNRVERSKSAWVRMRKAVFTKFMNMAGNPLIVKKNHVLLAPKTGYIDRLIADAKRRK